jgi:hypothetical protein
MEDKAKRAETSFVRYPVSKDVNPLKLEEMDICASYIS